MSLNRRDFEGLEQVKILGENQDWSVTGGNTDSRRIQSTDVFFALPGEKTDGHEFILDVFKKGVRVVVAKQEWVARHPVQLPPDACLVQVPDPLVALQRLARNWRNKFTLPVIAIGGSNGKTTTKEMVAAVLSKKLRTMKTEGNFNNHIGLPLTLLRLNRDHQAAVIEMGENHLGELASLCDIAQPTHGVLTNIGHDHLGEFGSFENNIRAKTELIEWIANHQGILFVNGDDKNIEQALKQVKRDPRNKKMKRIAFGQKSSADIHGKIRSIQKNGCLNLVVDGVELKLRTPGQHQMGNVLAAWAVGDHFSVSPADRKQALEDFEPPSKRMEMVTIKKIIFLNDSYNANPDSMRAALETIQKIETGEKGRKIAVLGDMLELGSFGPEEHRKLGQYLAQQNIDFLFTYGELMQYTASEAIKYRMQNVQHYGDKKKLAVTLLEFLKSNDVVLIKGSRSMRMEEVLETLKR